MSFNIYDIEKKLNKCKDHLNHEEDKLKGMILNLIENDNSNNDEYIDLLDDIIDDNKKGYYKANKAYKKYISQYSKSYIEMSEYYYGPELPYDIYCKEFEIFNNNGTYLDTAKDINDLYSLFIFFTMYNYCLSETLLGSDGTQ